MFYNFDVFRWVRQQLPPILRQSVLLSLLLALVSPLVMLYEAFSAYRRSVNRQLSYNAFVIYLEKFLNDLYNNEYYIFIEDVRGEATLFMARKEENKPKDYFSLVSEGKPVYVADTDRLVGSFIVWVPNALADETPTISRWVEYYKFAGTTFEIQLY